MKFPGSQLWTLCYLDPGVIKPAVSDLFLWICVCLSDPLAGWGYRVCRRGDWFSNSADHPWSLRGLHGAHHCPQTAHRRHLRPCHGHGCWQGRTSLRSMDILWWLSPVDNSVTFNVRLAGSLDYYLFSTLLRNTGENTKMCADCGV